MWKAALTRALTVLLPVAALSFWGWHVVRGAVDNAAERHSRALAHSLGQRINDALRDMDRALYQLCRFDHRAQRLATELQGGLPAADATRSVVAMARTAGLDQLTLQRTDDHTPLAWTESGTAPRTPEQGRASARDGQLWLHARCKLGLDLTLSATRGFELNRGLPDDVDLRLSSATAPAPEAGFSRAWSRGEEGTVQVWLRDPEPQRPLAAFEAGAAVCLVLALGLVLLSLRAGGGSAGPAEITALTAIEQAAARVARGDLVSHIGLRTGTQVDRTLHAFDRMTEELRATREKLVKAERAAAWQDMARRIAHEIKNPLSPIRTAMETLRKAHARRHPEFDEIFEESSRAILEEVERLQHIVREFSEFARLPKPRPGAIDLRDTAEHAVTVVKHGEVPIHLSADASMPAARADREQLTQVLLNLLQNACTVASEARGRQARVELRLRPTEQHVRLEIHDNGPGVPADRREQIFEPYFTQSKEGSGLGLTIAARIVEEHEGKLTVDDSPLGGACFTFELPVASPDTDATPTVR